MKKALTIAVFFWALPTLAQSTTGELRLTVTDPAGLGLKSTVELVSQGNDYRQAFTTDDQGNLDAKRLPYGIYQAQIEAQGFETPDEILTQGRTGGGHRLPLRTCDPFTQPAKYERSLTYVAQDLPR